MDADNGVSHSCGLYKDSPQKSKSHISPFQNDASRDWEEDKSWGNNMGHSYLGVSF